VLLLSGNAFAHPGETHVSPSNWTRAWSWEPGVVVPMAITALLYLAGVARLYSRNRVNPAIRRWEIGCFATGWIA
jgi:putative membrane protein